jgi:sugar phosphate isomerase/epimerase
MSDLAPSMDGTSGKTTVTPAGGGRAAWPRFESRRGFLRGLAAGVAWLAPARAASVGGYLVGCYTRPWDQFELGQALDGIAEAGYHWAGLMTAKGKSWVVITPQTTEAEAGRIGQQVRKRGLQVCSVYGDFSVSDSRSTARDQLRRLIDNAAACGSPELLLGGTAAREQYDEYYRAIAEECGHAESRRVGLTIKPHGGLNATGAACREVIERVSHPNFRLWYDPGNIFYYSDGARDPLQDVLDIDGLVVGMSIKDFRPPKEVMVTPGTGQVNFPALFARLRLGGFIRGQLVVECTARGDFAAITREANAARRFVEQLARGRALDSLRSDAPP